MLNEKELPFLAEKGHIVSLVGGGGKTTLLYAMADHCARKGWQVLVTTTTHIRQPAACYAPDDAALTALWQAGRYAVIGTPAENGKLTLPPPQLLRRMAQADAVFIEADGAKHYPCKVPAAHEPVLLPQSDIVLALAGLSALDRLAGGLLPLRYHPSAVFSGCAGCTSYAPCAGTAACKHAGWSQGGGRPTVLRCTQSGRHAGIAAAGHTDTTAFVSAWYKVRADAF